jgi:DNA polymerase
MHHTMPYLLDQIRAIRPEVIVILGATALKALLPDVREGITRARGRWLQWSDPASDLRIALMPTFHPAFLLRQYTPENRRAMWSDLKLVLEKLGLPLPAGKASDA